MESRRSSDQMESRGSSDQEDEQIVQVREALMYPNGGKFEVLRTARFLNYTTTSIDDDVFELPLDAFVYRPESLEPTKWKEKISFTGWGTPSVNWIEWVNTMVELHETVWRKSGVYDAIMASRYQIKKQDNLLMGLVEKWCIETNTFVFPWGEATVTLEDMIVLGGFSVFGNNALAPVKREDMKEVEEKMKKAKQEIEANLEKKCCVSSWMKEMMNSGNEIEHEAFMVSWLSRFVFPNSGDLLRDMLFPAAIQLAKGGRLALAPAVLAGIYRDLGLLKKQIACVGEREMVVVKSPFQFVQVWAFERIMELQPPGQPSQLKHGEPWMARWQQHGRGQDEYRYHDNIRTVLDSAKESFDYRPYTKPLNNFEFPRFYVEDGCWFRVNSDDKNIVAFGRCLRFSKLVGLDCIEPYYPHRVALQFGYDQGVPGVVPARIETPELAWKNYIRPISDEMLYIPARLHTANVTVGYIRWWKHSVAILQAEAKRISQKLLALPPRQKPVTITAAATTTSKLTSSPGKWKTVGAKAKKGSSGTGSRIEVNRAEDQSNGSNSCSGSVTGSEQASKRPVKMPEWVQRSPPRSIKSLGRSSARSVDDVNDLKGALKGSGETKGHHGHVTFQLPGSSTTPTQSAKQSGSVVKKTRLVPRVANLAKPSSSSPRVPRPTSSVPHKPENSIKNNSPSPRVSKEPYKSPSLSGSPLKKNKTPRSPKAVNSPGQKNPSSSSVSRESHKSPSVSGSTSLTKKKSQKSPEAVNSQSNNNSPSPQASKEKNKSPSSSGSPSLTTKKSPRSVTSSGGRNTDLTEPESPSKTHQLDIGKANNADFPEEIVTLRAHMSEGGEVTYQIPKQQFADLSQGFQDVLHDLQSIKSALNIVDDDDDE